MFLHLVVWVNTFANKVGVITLVMLIQFLVYMQERSQQYSAFCRDSGPLPNMDAAWKAIPYGDGK